MTYIDFASLADKDGLTAAIRYAMSQGMTRGEAGKWEMQYIREHAVKTP